MKPPRRRLYALGVLLLCLACAARAAAQDSATSDEPDLGWNNTLDLSIVLTEGNSSTETFGFDDRLVRRGKKSHFELKLNAVRADTADDRYRQVNAGEQWPVGAPAPPVTPDLTYLVTPSLEPDVEKYWVEPNYSRDFLTNAFWTVGASWNRDVDAGLINRYVGYATMGNQWYEKEHLKFRTTYGLSYTDREEESPDPLKYDQFLGMRFHFYYWVEFGKSHNLTYDNDWDFTGSFRDLQDFYSTMMQSFSVKMTKHLSLKVSLQWLYSNLPATEDIDLVAQVVVVDPDGTPGSGDEYFETVDSGGAELELGEVQERKQKLDTTFRTSLSIKW